MISGSRGSGPGQVFCYEWRLTLSRYRGSVLIAEEPSESN
jgi:hypothetical protein